MQKISDVLYRFRGLILALLAALLLVTPFTLVSFPEKYRYVNSHDLTAFFGLYLIAFLLYAYGILLRVRARQYIGQHTRGSRHEAGELVTSGPYAYCRHPLYTSNTSIALGAVLFHLDFNIVHPGLCFIAAILVFEYLLARAEDRYLKKKFGDTWQSWARTTPAFPLNPAVLFPAKAPTPMRTFFQAFKADASTWLWFTVLNLLIILVKIYAVWPAIQAHG